MPSIKSDRYIIKKSMLPTHRAIEGGVLKGFGWAGVDFVLETSDASVSVAVGAIVYAPVTEHDIEVFHLQNPWFPMISPFLAEQESYIDRPLTDIEKINYQYDNTYPIPGGVVVSTDAGFVLRQKVISSGVSSYGYDVKCANEFKVFTNINNSIVDPKNFDPACFVDVVGDKCIIPPNSFALARTVEWFKIPRNVLTVCLGKSTYARCGIIVNVTPLEPEWEGHVTLEFSNTTNLPAIIYANEGVAQMLFFESDEDCLVSYKDRGGKYQGQSGVVVPRMK